MNITQAYSDFMIPKNLQEHMLRVAALAKIISDNWNGMAIDEKSVVQACALHDIAKPMNFDLTKQAQYGMSPEEINSLDKLQKRLKSNYGENEHDATVKVCGEIGCSKTALKVVNNLEWSYIPKLMKENETESLVAIYCDMRIGPKGILLLNQRLDDLKLRTNTNKHEENVNNGSLLEKLIKKNCSGNLDTISNERINSFFNELLSLEM